MATVTRDKAEEQTAARVNALAAEVASPSTEPDVVAEMRTELDRIRGELAELRLLRVAGAAIPGVTPAVVAVSSALELKQMEAEREDIRTLLKNAPRISIEIPLEAEDKSALGRAQEQGRLDLWPVWRCQINGVIFNVRKGEQVSVPEPIYELWKQSQQLQQHRLNVTPAGENRPGFWVDGDTPFA